VFFKIKKSKALYDDLSYIDDLLIDKEFTDNFSSKIKKHEKLPKHVLVYIKEKEKPLRRKIWSDFFMAITKAFKKEHREQEGKLLNKIYYTLIELLPELFDSQEDENIFFSSLSVSLGDSEEYGRELIVYRALRYCIHYNDEEGCKKILDSRFLKKNEIYFCSLDFSDDTDPVDQSKIIKWFLYRYDMANAIRYLSLVSWKWSFLIKLIHILINKKGATVILSLFMIYCNLPCLWNVKIEERYFYYLEFAVITLFLTVYLVNKATAKNIDDTKAMLLLFQVSLPRLWGAILMGLINIALSDRSWTFPLRIKERHFFIICILTFISAYLYLYLEVSSQVSDSKQATARTSKIVTLGLIEAFFFSYLICQIFAESVIPDLVPKEELIVFQGERMYNISNILVMPKFIPTIKCYPTLIILWSFLSLLIGMFIQNFWDRENLISSPFADDMTLEVAPKPGVEEREA